MDLESVIDRIKRILSEKGSAVVAIDGRCASGKTTLAQKIGKRLGGAVVHTDDFFLPTHMRTQERLSSPGGNIHYERLFDEVISHIGEKHISCGRFDCSSCSITETVDIDCSELLIIEGAYSMHPYFGNYYDLSVFASADIETRLQRIKLRNGEERLEAFKSKWIPLEERYIEHYLVHNKADILIVN